MGRRKERQRLKRTCLRARARQNCYDDLPLPSSSTAERKRPDFALSRVARITTCYTTPLDLPSQRGAHNEARDSIQSSIQTRGKIFIHASTIITTNKTPYSSVDINISLLHRVYYISRIFDSHDLHVSMDDFFFIPISTSMEHKARRYHNPRLRLPSLPPATNFAASIACMASFAAVRGNQVEKKFRIS